MGTNATLPYSYATRVGEKTAWTARLRHVPTWALHEEIQRRGEEPGADQAVRLSGVVVDPVAGIVTWRGDEYALTGRALEIVYAIAQTHREGRRRVRSEEIARQVYRGWGMPDALNNVRATIHLLRKRIPGLLPKIVPGYYELAMGELPAAEVGAA